MTVLPVETTIKAMRNEYKEINSQMFLDIKADDFHVFTHPNSTTRHTFFIGKIMIMHLTIEDGIEVAKHWCDR